MPRLPRQKKDQIAVVAGLQAEREGMSNQIGSGLPLDPPPHEQEELSETGVVVMLRPEDRKKLLGRLAEFELKLLDLNPLQQNFVMAFVMDPTDASAAARKAGYSEKRCAATACDLLAKPHVAACIALGEQLREDRTMITSDRTLHEIAIIAFSDITDFSIGPGGRIDTKPGVPSYATRAIKSVEWTSIEREDEEGKPVITYKTKIALWPKDVALRMLAVYQKLLSGDGTVVNATVNNDNRGQTHHHEHQHQTWQIGDLTLNF
jgi:phage terminase small subunit